MNYFAIQVRTGTEERYLKLTEAGIQENDISFLWLRRALRIRKQGVWRETLTPLFPGYLFLSANDVPSDLFLKMKSIPGFYRFLPSNGRIRPLDSKDVQMLDHFLRFGEIIHQSLATFGRDDRIEIISGPLKGLEGRIVKVDRRKGRAKVLLDICNNSFTIDFGFEVIEKSVSH